jgi:hypothetical protein
MEKLGALIPILAESGIDFLNLHQLRMTPHNSRFFKSRHYTLLHGEKVTVLESELSVLSLFAKAIDQGWTLPIHYCSFAYKNQFQKAAARKRSAGFILKPFEALTQSGFIRSIQITGEPDAMESLNSQFAQKNIPPDRFQMREDKSRIWVHESLWPHFSKEQVEIQLDYYEAVLNQSLSYRNPFKEIRLEGGMKLYVEKQARHLGTKLSAGEIQNFEKFVIHKHLVPETFWPQTPWEEYEFIREGLQEYF